MNRRFFLIAAMAGMLSLAAAPPAFADDDGTSGSDDDNSDSGPGPSGGPDDGNDDGGGHGNDGGGNDGGHNSGSGNSGDFEIEDNSAARLAVAAKDAVPLTVILRQFRALGTYTLIDVKLSRSNRTLLYIVKYIDRDGRVAKTFFDARTGELVK